MIVKNDFHFLTWTLGWIFKTLSSLFPLFRFSSLFFTKSQIYTVSILIKIFFGRNTWTLRALPLLSTWLRTSLVAQTIKCLDYNARDLGSIPESGRSSGEGNGNPLQYSSLENHMDRGAWWVTVHGVAKSWTRLSKFTSLLRKFRGIIYTTILSLYPLHH